MNNIFSPDSKLITILEGLANTILLNVLFLLCCVPVLTIGAAFTALFSGCRSLLRDGACFRAFFRAFRTNFKRATLAWLILLPLLILLALTAYNVWVLLQQGMALSKFTFVVSLIALTLGLAVTTMVFLFYSRFECTLGQLLKNGLFMTLAYFLRAIIIGVAMWLPVIMFFLTPYTFVQLSLVALFLYFGVAASLSVWLMTKPFDSLVDEALEARRTEEEQAVN